VLVVGSGLAMGIQAAAMRYIGPAGTPTSFLSGTVTNWVSGLVELHKPFAWNWNSPLRIGVIVVAAAGNAVLQHRFPDLAFAAPIALVLAAIVMMARVTRANHGGLVAGEPQFAPGSGAEVPEPSPAEPSQLAGETGPAGVGRVLGRVVDAAGEPSPAAVTLVDMTGRQVHRIHTETDGRFDVQPPEAGHFVLICTPHRMGGRAHRPQARMVSVDGVAVAHEVVLGAT
jgi:hypothetical protein